MTYIDLFWNFCTCLLFRYKSKSGIWRNNIVKLMFSSNGHILYLSEICVRIYNPLILYLIMIKVCYICHIYFSCVKFVIKCLFYQEFMDISFRVWHLNGNLSIWMHMSIDTHINSVRKLWIKNTLNALYLWTYFAK